MPSNDMETPLSAHFKDSNNSCLAHYAALCLFISTADEWTLPQKDKATEYHLAFPLSSDFLPLSAHCFGFIFPDVTQRHRGTLRAAVDKTEAGRQSQKLSVRAEEAR